ncbi:hypothetical protein YASMINEVIRUS_1609, partial [Yasminevirus sp. GU-2018]
LNTYVTGYTKSDGCILVNCVDTNNMYSYECDILIDCTYNQLQLSCKEYKYELTCSLMLKQNRELSFGALTLMDGNFLSIYPRSKKEGLYTLTDVEFTPIITSCDYQDVENYVVTDSKIREIKGNMFCKVKKYYPGFEDDFEYIGYFLSKKTKQITGSDSRDIVIEKVDDNVITVNCGKIYGIFEFEKYLRETLNL